LILLEGNLEENLEDLEWARTFVEKSPKAQGFIKKLLLGMVLQTYNPSTWEAEAGVSESQPKLHNKF
jgi:hypothetical protein